MMKSSQPPSGDDTRKVPVGGHQLMRVTHLRHREGLALCEDEAGRSRLVDISRVVAVVRGDWLLVVRGVAVNLLEGSGRTPSPLPPPRGETE
jgi:hypothetical protein